MILEADRNGCVREVLIIAAALSIQDPRERPADAQQAADEKHRRFADPDSDFVAYLNLWDYLAEQQRELSSSAFRRLCRADFLNYLRVREWQDLQGSCKGWPAILGGDGRFNFGRTVPGARLPAGRTALADRDARSIRKGGTRPACCLGTIRAPAAGGVPRRPQRPVRHLPRVRPVQEAAATGSWRPSWWRRPGCGRGSSARIEPEWAEPLARHLVKRSYSEPHWEKKRGGAVALEKVTLYGVPLVADRKVAYGRIDPAAARELFIRHALVEGDWQTSHRFFAENRRLLAEAEEVEHRARRRGLVADEDELFAFYDARIPAEVVSAQHFDTWWKQARRADPGLLTFKAGDLLSDAAAGVSADAYPDVWTSESAGVQPVPLLLRLRAGKRDRRRHRGHPAGQAQPGERRPTSPGRCPGCAPSWSPS